MQAVILIGGLGTRLRPFTLKTPKPLLPIAGRPFIWHQLTAIKKAGISEVILCVSYKAEKFCRMLPKLGIKGLKIRFTKETVPMGTGGAVKLAQPFQKGPLLVLNGDVLSSIDYKKLIDFHNGKNADITLTLTRVKDPSSYGLIETDRESRVKSFLEKPPADKITTDTINAGAYVFAKDMLEHIPAQTPYSLERNFFPNMLKSGKRIYGWIDSSYWMDIGSVDKFLRANMDALAMKSGFALPGKKRAPNLQSKTAVKIGKNAVISGRAFFGSNCAVGESAVLRGNIIAGDNVTIGKEAVLENCVILSGTGIGAMAEIRNCVIGENCRIGANASVTKGALGDGSCIRPYSRL